MMHKSLAALSVVVFSIVVLLLGPVCAFTPVPSFQSRRSTTTTTTVSMSTDTSAKPAIEVISQPDQAFLEEKGCVEMALC